MTDTESEAVAWIIRADNGYTRLWTGDGQSALEKAAEWDQTAEPLYGPEVLARALKAEALLEEAVKAMKIAEHDLTTTHNLRSTDLSPDQMNDALKRGVALSDLEWMTDNSRGCAAIRTTLTAITKDQDQ